MMIDLDNAVEWLKENYRDFWGYIEYDDDPTEMFDLFRKEMTEKTNPIFERCLAKVNPDIRAEVRKNMDAALTWHKVSEELPPVDIEVVCKMEGVLYTKHFVCKWDGRHWWHWANVGQGIQGWFGLNRGWEVVEWKEI